MTLALDTQGPLWKRKSRDPKNRGKTLVELGWKPKAGLSTISRLSAAVHSDRYARAAYVRWLAERDGISPNDVVIPNENADLSRVDVVYEDGPEPHPAVVASRLPENEGRTLAELGWKPRNVSLTPISRLSGNYTRRWTCRETEQLPLEVL